MPGSYFVLLYLQTWANKIKEDAMTFWETFNAEQLFLKKAKEIIDTVKEHPEGKYLDTEAMEEYSIGIVYCGFAFEAILNIMLRTYDQDLFIAKQRDCIKSKLKLLKKEIGISFDKSNEPWSSIDELVGARNWLAHYKYQKPGLVGSEGYAKTADTKTGEIYDTEPIYAPKKTLTKENLIRYYNSVLIGSREIAAKIGVKNELMFLWNEEYEPFIYG